MTTKWSYTDNYGNLDGVTLGYVMSTMFVNVWDCLRCWLSAISSSVSISLTHLFCCERLCDRRYVEFGLTEWCFKTSITGFTGSDFLVCSKYTVCTPSFHFYPFHHVTSQLLNLHLCAHNLNVPVTAIPLDDSFTIASKT